MGWKNIKKSYGTVIRNEKRSHYSTVKLVVTNSSTTTHFYLTSNGWTILISRKKTEKSLEVIWRSLTTIQQSMSGCCFLQCLRDYINRRRVKISLGLFSVLGTQVAGLRLCEFYLFRVCSEMRDDFRLNGWHHKTKNNCTKKSNQLMLLTFD